MQRKNLELKEIIWEITGECKNGCSYCGSKENRNIKTDESTILKIATEISKFPPRAIDISGGDPLLLGYDLHKKIIDILKDVPSKKIIINPKSFENTKDFIKILGLYDWIGISINTKEEIDIFYDLYASSKYDFYAISNIFNKMTIITNFNLLNIFIYEKIEELVEKNDYSWQIQFTIDKNNSDNNIFNNEGALKHFSDLVNKSIEKGVKITLADNMNECNCGAGISSLGILYNGDIVPCLSMRSWKDGIEKEVQGNILETSLKLIWTEGFYQYRFDQFECCKDFCKNKVVKIEKIEKNEYDKIFEEIQSIKIKNPPKIEYPNITMYGVQPYGTIVYGVQQTQTIMYAIRTDFETKKE